LGATSSFVSRQRWLICLLLFFPTTVNSIECQVLVLLKPILDDELPISIVGWSLAAFGLGHLLAPRFEPIEFKISKEA
jgi:MFS transporter, ACS family, hexuronate transporter